MSRILSMAMAVSSPAILFRWLEYSTQSMNLMKPAASPGTCPGRGLSPQTVKKVAKQKQTFERYAQYDADNWTLIKPGCILLLYTFFMNRCYAVILCLLTSNRSCFLHNNRLYRKTGEIPYIDFLHYCHFFYSNCLHIDMEFCIIDFRLSDRSSSGR